MPCLVGRPTAASAPLATNQVRVGAHQSFKSRSDRWVGIRGLGLTIAGAAGDGVTGRVSRSRSGNHSRHRTHSANAERGGVGAERVGTTCPAGSAAVRPGVVDSSLDAAVRQRRAGGRAGRSDGYRQRDALACGCLRRRRILWQHRADRSGQSPQGEPPGSASLASAAPLRRRRRAHRGGPPELRSPAVSAIAGSAGHRRTVMRRRFLAKSSIRSRHGRERVAVMGDLVPTTVG